MLQIGQTATLLSGGPLMTVIAVNKYGDRGLFAWFTEQPNADLRQVWLEPAAVRFQGQQ